MKKKYYKAKIKDKDWTFLAQTKAAYSRMHGRDSEGITYTKEKEVYLNMEYITPSIVRHEVFHCYVYGTGTNSSDLTTDQMEELCATIYEEHGPEMDLLVDKILEHFLK